MALMWGWGPFAIRPEGAEVKVGEAVKDAIRVHSNALQGSGDFYPAAVKMTETIQKLWEVVEGRIFIPRELAPISYPTLGLEAIAATLIASVLNIEYELQRAEMMDATLNPEGPAVWQFCATARDTTSNRSVGDLSFSERFDRTDEKGREAQFLLGAVRSYVNLISALVPFRK